MALAPKGHGAFGGTVVGTDAAGTIKLAAFFGYIVDSLGDLTEAREKIEYTNSASPTAGGVAGAQFRPGDIVTTEDYELTILHDTQADPPWGVEEVIVITLPLRGTEATAAKKTFTGFLTKHVSSMPFKDKMVTKCTLAITGLVVHAPAA